MACADFRLVCRPLRRNRTKTKKNRKCSRRRKQKHRSLLNQADLHEIRILKSIWLPWIPTRMSLAMLRNAVLDMKTQLKARVNQLDIVNRNPMLTQSCAERELYRKEHELNQTQRVQGFYQSRNIIPECQRRLKSKGVYLEAQDKKYSSSQDRHFGPNYLRLAHDAIGEYKTFDIGNCSESKPQKCIESFRLWHVPKSMLGLQDVKRDDCERASSYTKKEMPGWFLDLFTDGLLLELGSSYPKDVPIQCEELRDLVKRPRFLYIDTNGKSNGNRKARSWKVQDYFIFTEGLLSSIKNSHSSQISDVPSSISGVFEKQTFGTRNKMDQECSVPKRKAEKIKNIDFPTTKITCNDKLPQSHMSADLLATGLNLGRHAPQDNAEEYKYPHEDYIYKAIETTTDKSRVNSKNRISRKPSTETLREPTRSASSLLSRTYIRVSEIVQRLKQPIKMSKNKSAANLTAKAAHIVYVSGVQYERDEMATQLCALPDWLPPNIGPRLPHREEKSENVNNSSLTNGSTYVEYAQNQITVACGSQARGIDNGGRIRPVSKISMPQASRESSKLKSPQRHRLTRISKQSSTHFQSGPTHAYAEGDFVGHGYEPLSFHKMRMKLHEFVRKEWRSTHSVDLYKSMYNKDIEDMDSQAEDGIASILYQNSDHDNMSSEDGEGFSSAVTNEKLMKNPAHSGNCPLTSVHIESKGSDQDFVSFQTLRFHNKEPPHSCKILKYSPSTIEPQEENNYLNPYSPLNKLPEPKGNITEKGPRLLMHELLDRYKGGKETASERQEYDDTQTSLPVHFDQISRDENWTTSDLPQDVKHTDSMAVCDESTNPPSFCSILHTGNLHRLPAPPARLIFPCRTSDLEVNVNTSSKASETKKKKKKTSQTKRKPEASVKQTWRKHVVKDICTQTKIRGNSSNIAIYPNVQPNLDLRDSVKLVILNQSPPGVSCKEVHMNTTPKSPPNVAHCIDTNVGQNHGCEDCFLDRLNQDPKYTDHAAGNLNQYQICESEPQNQKYIDHSPQQQKFESHSAQSLNHEERCGQQQKYKNNFTEQNKCDDDFAHLQKYKNCSPQRSKHDDICSNKVSHYQKHGGCYDQHRDNESDLHEAQKDKLHSADPQNYSIQSADPSKNEAHFPQPLKAMDPSSEKSKFKSEDRSTDHLIQSQNCGVNSDQRYKHGGDVPQSHSYEGRSDDRLNQYQKYEEHPGQRQEHEHNRNPKPVCKEYSHSNFGQCQKYKYHSDQSQKYGSRSEDSLNRRINYGTRSDSFKQLHNHDDNSSFRLKINPPVAPFKDFTRNHKDTHNETPSQDEGEEQNNEYQVDYLSARNTPTSHQLGPSLDDPPGPERQSILTVDSQPTVSINQENLNSHTSKDWSRFPAQQGFRSSVTAQIPVTATNTHQSVAAVSWPSGSSMGATSSSTESVNRGRTYRTQNYINHINSLNLLKMAQQNRATSNELNARKQHSQQPGEHTSIDNPAVKQVSFPNNESPCDKRNAWPSLRITNSRTPHVNNRWSSQWRRHTPSKAYSCNFVPSQETKPTRSRHPCSLGQVGARPSRSCNGNEARGRCPTSPNPETLPESCKMSSPERIMQFQLDVLSCVNQILSTGINQNLQNRLDGSNSLSKPSHAQTVRSSCSYPSSLPDTPSLPRYARQLTTRDDLCRGTYRSYTPSKVPQKPDTLSWRLGQYGNRNGTKARVQQQNGESRTRYSYHKTPKSHTFANVQQDRCAPLCKYCDQCVCRNHGIEKVQRQNYELPSRLINEEEFSSYRKNKVEPEAEKRTTETGIQTENLDFWGGSGCNCFSKNEKKQANAQCNEESVISDLAWGCESSRATLAETADHNAKPCFDRITSSAETSFGHEDQSKRPMTISDATQTSSSSLWPREKAQANKKCQVGRPKVNSKHQAMSQCVSASARSTKKACNSQPRGWSTQIDQWMQCPDSGTFEVCSEPIHTEDDELEQYESNSFAMNQKPHQSAPRSNSKIQTDYSNGTKARNLSSSWQSRITDSEKEKKKIHKCQEKVDTTSDCRRKRCPQEADSSSEKCSPADTPKTPLRSPIIHIRYRSRNKTPGCTSSNSNECLGRSNECDQSLAKDIIGKKLAQVFRQSLDLQKEILRLQESSTDENKCHSNNEVQVPSLSKNHRVPFGGKDNDRQHENRNSNAKSSMLPNSSSFESLSAVSVDRLTVTNTNNVLKNIPNSGALVSGLSKSVTSNTNSPTLDEKQCPNNGSGAGRVNPEDATHRLCVGNRQKQSHWHHLLYATDTLLRKERNALQKPLENIRDPPCCESIDYREKRINDIKQLQRRQEKEKDQSFLDNSSEISRGQRKKVYQVTKSVRHMRSVPTETPQRTTGCKQANDVGEEKHEDGDFSKIGSPLQISENNTLSERKMTPKQLTQVFDTNVCHLLNANYWKSHWDMNSVGAAQTFLSMTKRSSKYRAERNQRQEMDLTALNWKSISMGTTASKSYTAEELSEDMEMLSDDGENEMPPKLKCKSLKEEETTESIQKCTNWPQRQMSALPQTIRDSGLKQRNDSPDSASMISHGSPSSSLFSVKIKMSRENLTRKRLDWESSTHGVEDIRVDADSESHHELKATGSNQHRHADNKSQSSEAMFETYAGHEVSDPRSPLVDDSQRDIEMCKISKNRLNWSLSERPVCKETDEEIQRKCVVLRDMGNSNSQEKKSEGFQNHMSPFTAASRGDYSRASCNRDNVSSERISHASDTTKSAACQTTELLTETQTIHTFHLKREERELEDSAGRIPTIKMPQMRRHFPKHDDVHEQGSSGDISSGPKCWDILNEERYKHGAGNDDGLLSRRSAYFYKISRHEHCKEKFQVSCEKECDTLNNKGCKYLPASNEDSCGSRHNMKPKFIKTLPSKDITLYEVRKTIKTETNYGKERELDCKINQKRKKSTNPRRQKSVSATVHDHPMAAGDINPKSVSLVGLGRVEEADVDRVVVAGVFDTRQTSSISSRSMGQCHDQLLDFRFVIYRKRPCEDDCASQNLYGTYMRQMNTSKKFFKWCFNTKDYGKV